MLQVDPIQSYLNLKIGLPPVLKAGSSGKRSRLNKRFGTSFLQARYDRPKDHRFTIEWQKIE